LLEIEKFMYLLIIISVIQFFTELPTHILRKRNYNPVVAHRGAWKAAGHPENSIASLKYAIKLGCIGSEFDVRMTADNVAVVNHDPTYFGLEIENVRYEDLLAHKLSNGEKIPTLEEYILAGLKKNKKTRLVLEIKPSTKGKTRAIEIAEKIYQQVNALKAQKMVDYISFDIEMLKTLVRLNPNVTTQHLNSDLSPEEIKALGISGIDYNYQVFKKKPEWIKQAKELGLILNVWTVNNVEDIDYFLKQKFDFITTNEPELTKERLKALNSDLK
jgi:glycerophosphoryl diester phosphodiesterase